MGSKGLILSEALMVVLTCFGVASGNAFAANTEVSVEEIATMLQRRIEQVENLALNAQWKTYEDGKLVSTVSQVIHQDQFGRIRVRSLTRREGALPRWLDQLYNGELTLIARDDWNRTRLGEANTEPTIAAGERYRHAIIYDGLKRDPHRTRNPFKFGYTGIIAALERHVSAQEHPELGIRRREDLGEVFELRYRMPPELDSFEREHVVLVDAAKGWIVLSAEQFFPDGKLGVKTTYEYVPDEEGLWLPAAGRARSWGKTRDVSEPPLWEWAFDVERIVVDDPDFDESVFEPTLLPMTRVSDLRYDATYRVGSEEAIGEELSLLAQQARAEEEANLQRIEEGVEALKAMKESESAWRIGNRLRFALVAINVAVVAALAAVWWFRRKAGK